MFQLDARGEAVHDRHLVVGDDEVWAFFCGHVTEFDAIAGDEDLVAALLNVEREHLCEKRFVVGDDDRLLAHGRVLHGMRRRLLRLQIDSSVDDIVADRE